MLIRKPPGEVFNAFVDPEIITTFWLSSASKPLAPSASVKWAFMVNGATADVQVTEFEKARRIGFVWSGGKTVKIDFSSQGEVETRVSVRETGYSIEEVDEAIESTQGFTIVLCDLKTLLEQGRSAGLAKDKAELIERMMK